MNNQVEIHVRMSNTFLALKSHINDQFEKHPQPIFSGITIFFEIKVYFHFDVKQHSFSMIYLTLTFISSLMPHIKVTQSSQISLTVVLELAQLRCHRTVTLEDKL